MRADAAKAIHGGGTIFNVSGIIDVKFAVLMHKNRKWRRRARAGHNRPAGLIYGSILVHAQEQSGFASSTKACSTCMHMCAQPIPQ